MKWKVKDLALKVSLGLMATGIAIVSRWQLQTMVHLQPAEQYQWFNAKHCPQGYMPSQSICGS